MVDAPDKLDSQQPMVSMPEEKPAGFFSGTTGKLVLGGVAFIVVLIVLGAIAWAFLLNTPSPRTGGKVVAATVTPASAPTAADSTSAPDAVVITEPQEKPLESTFTFRNVFAPTLKEPSPASVLASITAESSSSSSTSVKVAKDTLYLSSIQTVNGKKTATFIWNGTTYNLSEGDTISDTPWKVIEIDDSSVVMLYGDTQVTLTAGQGLTK